MNATTARQLKHAAQQCVERWKFSVIPIAPDTKTPAIKWKEFQERRATPEEINRWPASNIGLVTGAISGVVIIDCESRVDAKWFYSTLGKSPVIVQSRRGFHFWFRHPGFQVKNAQRVHNRYDIRGDGGYALIPPSLHKDGCYRFVANCEFKAVEELPLFRAEWLPQPKIGNGNAKAVTDGIKYISAIRAIAGQRGHANTYRAVCRLRDAGLSESQALAAMIDWNETNAKPKWSTGELLHKVQDVFRT